MKYFLAAAALAISLHAQADTRGCAARPVMTTKLADGTTMGVLVSEAQFRKAPSWTPGRREPPLSVAQVVEGAQKWAKAHYQGYDSADIVSISLSRRGCHDEPKYWFYMVHFLPIKAGKPVMDASFAAVLFDATVIAPTRVENPFK